MFNTVTVAIHTTPVVFTVAFTHLARKVRNLVGSGKTTGLASDDLLFDEAFHIVRCFIALATQNVLEDLQAFTNTHVPSPFGCAVYALCIPMQSCDAAAKLLIDVLGDDCAAVAGGTRWWQVRGLNGIEAEWLALREDLRMQSQHDARKRSGNLDGYPEAFDRLRRVMLYIHGGGYSWGSINTHRYQLEKYAQKINGRIFAVNYRKAPQFPWPCPLQDALAAYLFLTEPPDGAPHQAVSPRQLVLGGDSAGAGICVSLLTILRDLGKQLPSGAFLVSPWVDLTHSLPSVMENAQKDIIPRYGFLHKPSPVWGGHNTSKTEECDVVAAFNDLVVDLEDGPSTIHGQIQQYASNSQLLHPLVSPLLAGSLGNLCPLYIIAGDREVLRDEAIYLAHRAADPSKYPVRDVLLQSQRQKWQAATFAEPTKVHLQLLDDFCHVPTVFTFTPAARYVYQSVGEFAKHVIDQDDEPIPPMHAQNKVPPATGESSLHENESGVELAHSRKSYPKNDRCEGAELRVKPEEVDLPSPSSVAKHLRVKNSSIKEDATKENQSRPNIVCERMDFSARLRSIDSDRELSVLNVPLDDIGVIKAAPVRRWQTGQSIWEKKFGHIHQDVEKRRRKYEKHAMTILTKLRGLGLLDDSFCPAYASGSRITLFDLKQYEEKPPPSAIVGRYDNAASLALLKAELWRCVLEAPDDIRASIWNVTPTTRIIPKEFPRQSPAEQQTVPSKLPIHGLTMWTNMTKYFLGVNARRARKARDKIIAATGADSLIRSIDVYDRTDDDGRQGD